jgi:hypothetical protein
MKPLVFCFVGKRRCTIAFETQKCGEVFCGAKEKYYDKNNSPKECPIIKPLFKTPKEA